MRRRDHMWGDFRIFHIYEKLNLFAEPCGTLQLFEDPLPIYGPIPIKRIGVITHIILPFSLVTLKIELFLNLVYKIYPNFVKSFYVLKS